MATAKFTNAQMFSVGDVVVDATAVYGREILARPFIQDIDQYRFITRAVSISNNKAVPAGVGKLHVQSTTELRNTFFSLWTPDVAPLFRKGDVLKDGKGGFYLAENDMVVWNIERGTWNAVIREDDKLLWGSSSRVPLTLHTTISGEPFSKKLGS